jgi:hypothetical protein
MYSKVKMTSLCQGAVHIFSVSQTLILQRFIYVTYKYDINKKHTLFSKYQNYPHRLHYFSLC